MQCKGKLYFVGLGLSGEHVTKQALDALADSDIILVDTYTSFYAEDILETVVKLSSKAKSVVKANRRMLEDDVNETILNPLLKGSVLAIVTAGDPFIATTHVSIRVEATRRGCEVYYVPGISIYSYAVSLSGLYNYKFGASATITYPTDENAEPSPRAYNVIATNKSQGFHTFLFLDIDFERGPMKPDYAVGILLSQEKKYGRHAVLPDERILVLERLGYSQERVFYLEVNEVLKRKWDNPPYSLIVPGPLNPIEREILEVLWLANGTRR